MKYIGENQKTNDCVVVGIFNASLWLKKDMSYNDIEWLAKEYYEYDSEIGLDSFFLNDFMKFVNIPFKSLKDSTIEEAEKEILSGNGVLAAVFDKDYGGGHMIFMRPKGKEIEVLNYNKKWIDIVIGHSKKEMKLSMWNVGKEAA